MSSIKILLTRRRFLAQLLSLAGISVACAAPPPNPSLVASAATPTMPATTPTSQPSSTFTPTLMLPTVTPTLTQTPTPNANLQLATCIGTGTGTPLSITQPALPTPETFMRYAAEMRQLAVASGDQSFGAIIVKDNRVVGLGPSRVMVNRDPTAHAEIEAIRDACRRLGTTDLSGCVMYSTSKPCRMCETAAYWARVSRMVHGANLNDAGVPQYCN